MENFSAIFEKVSNFTYKDFRKFQISTKFQFQTKIRLPDAPIGLNSVYGRRQIWLTANFIDSNVGSRFVIPGCRTLKNPSTMLHFYRRALGRYTAYAMNDSHVIQFSEDLRRILKRYVKRDEGRFIKTTTIPEYLKPTYDNGRRYSLSATRPSRILRRPTVDDGILQNIDMACATAENHDEGLPTAADDRAQAKNSSAPPATYPILAPLAASAIAENLDGSEIPKRAKKRFADFSELEHITYPQRVMPDRGKMKILAINE